MTFKWLKSVFYVIWEDEIVIYHPLTGDTYLFSDDVKTIIEVIFSREHFDGDWLISSIGKQFVNKQQAIDLVERVIDRLISSYLIVIEEL